MDGLIIKLRAAAMSRRQIPKGRRGARALVETLSAGASLALLADQKLNDGISSAFFGRPAMTAPTPARLALKFDVPIIPVRVRRLRGPRFEITVEEPIQFRPQATTRRTSGRSPTK